MKIRFLLWFYIIGIMLYLRKRIAENTVLGIWRMDESVDDLYSMLDCKDWVAMIEQIRSESRKKEILATRVLLKELLGEEKQICYYDSGKPYLADQSNEISISHTQGYVALVVDKLHPVGLDIEKLSNKIFKVRDRIIAKNDFIDPDNEQIHLLLHWSAKEAMFKYLNAQDVDFRRNLHIKDFTPQAEGIFEASESKTEKIQAFDARYMVTSEFVLVCLLEK